MSFDESMDRMSRDRSTSLDKSVKLDQKFLIKNAKLVYKIEEDSFYVELYKDIAEERLGFGDALKGADGQFRPFGVREATQWIVHYELVKLKSTLVRMNMT